MLQKSNDERQNQLDQQKFAFDQAQAEREFHYKMMLDEHKAQLDLQKAQIQAAAHVEAAKHQPRPDDRA